MKRIIPFIVIFSLLFVCLTSCSGYNKVMRDHLSNADNYQVHEVFLKDFYYIDPITNEKKRDFADWAVCDSDIIFEVSFFNNVEELSPFLGMSLDEDVSLETYSFQFRITKNNGNILLANDFFEHITIGEKISVKVSDYIYMDAEFFYIAQLNYNGNEYLRFEEGLKNIVDMMNKDKSLF